MLAARRKMREDELQRFAPGVDTSRLSDQELESAIVIRQRAHYEREERGDRAPKRKRRR